MARATTLTRPVYAVSLLALLSDPIFPCLCTTKQKGVEYTGCELHNHCLQVRLLQKVGGGGGTHRQGIGISTSLTRSEAENTLGAWGLQRERGRQQAGDLRLGILPRLLGYGQ
jgi:hypothetical protein